MNAWWNARAPRERLILTIGAAVVMVSLFYGVLWHPLNSQITQRRAALLEQHSTLQWMQQATDELQRLRSQGPQSTPDAPGSSLLVVLESSAREHGIRDRITRMEPAGNDRVQLSLRDVNFDRTLQWIAALQQRHGMEISESSIVADDVRGNVDAALTLHRR